MFDFFAPKKDNNQLDLGSVVKGGLQVFSNIFGGNSRRDAVETPQVTNLNNTQENAMSGTETGTYTGATFFPTVSNLPSILNTGQRILKKILPTATGVGGGIALGNLGGSSGEICAPQSSAPYSVNKTSGCISVTRKQQAKLKDMVGLIGLEATANMIDLDAQTLVLLLKKFKGRGRGITAASMRTTKRTIRQIKSLHAEVSSMAGRKTPVRRTAAVKQVKYSN